MSKVSRTSKTRHIYSRHADPDYIRECPKCAAAICPNDCAVTDSEILAGRVVGSYHGTFTKFEDGLHPLHRRGVDFTDVGNILAGIDAQEESTANKIAARRKELHDEVGTKSVVDQN